MIQLITEIMAIIFIVLDLFNFVPILLCLPVCCLANHLNNIYEPCGGYYRKGVDYLLRSFVIYELGREFSHKILL